MLLKLENGIFHVFTVRELITFFAEGQADLNFFTCALV